MNGRRYIGSTINLEARRQLHVSRIKNRYPGTYTALMTDMDKYGMDAFTLGLLEATEPDEDALEAAERHWIARQEATAPGSLYNHDKTARRFGTTHRRKPRPQPAAALEAE